MIKTAQHSVHPTGGSRRVFWQFAWLEVGSVKMALPRPAHPRVTQAVRWLLIHAHGSLKQFEFHIQKGVLILLT